MLKTLLFRQKLVSLQLQPFLVLTQSNATVSQLLLEIVTQVSMQKENMQTEKSGNIHRGKGKNSNQKVPTSSEVLVSSNRSSLHHCVQLSIQNLNCLLFNSTPHSQCDHYKSINAAKTNIQTNDATKKHYNYVRVYPHPQISSLCYGHYEFA